MRHQPRGRKHRAEGRAKGERIRSSLQIALRIRVGKDLQTKQLQKTKQPLKIMKPLERKNPLRLTKLLERKMDFQVKWFLGRKRRQRKYIPRLKIFPSRKARSYLAWKIILTSY